MVPAKKQDLIPAFPNEFIKPCAGVNLKDVVNQTGYGDLLSGLLGPLSGLNASGTGIIETKISEGQLSGNIQIWQGVGAGPVRKGASS